MSIILKSNLKHSCNKYIEQIKFICENNSLVRSENYMSDHIKKYKSSFKNIINGTININNNKILTWLNTVHKLDPHSYGSEPINEEVLFKEHIKQVDFSEKANKIFKYSNFNNLLKEYNLFLYECKNNPGYVGKPCVGSFPRKG